MNSANDNSETKSCNVCGKLFKRLGCLKRHLLIVHIRDIRDRPFQCKTCGKSFSQMNHLKLHDRTHVTDEKLYRPTCDKCGKLFSSVSSLKKHNRTHTGEKPYVCNKCDKSFAEKRNLSSHICTHSEGEKPYFCDKCDESFAENAYLRKHNLTHTGQKLYPSDKFSKVCTQNCHLKTHGLKCTDRMKLYQCGTCKKSFTQLSKFKIHIREHNEPHQVLVILRLTPVCCSGLPDNKKSYRYDNCVKSSTEMEHFGKLDHTHNTEKPEVCDKSFKSKDSFKELHDHTENKLTNSFLSKGYFSDDVQKHVREVEEYLEEVSNYFNNG